VAEQTPGAGLDVLEAGESPGGPVLGPEPSPEPKHATRELLERLLDDLTFLVQTPEARVLKRNHSAFVDALKRLDYVLPVEAV
jgi:hypothetical protein